MSSNSEKETMTETRANASTESLHVSSSHPPEFRENRRLQEWIDGNTLHSCAQSEPETGITEVYFQSCLGVFQQLWTLILSNSELFTRHQKKTTKEALSRLVFWIDNYEPGQLDRSLSKANELRENILDLLTDIAKPLINRVLPAVLSTIQEKHRRTDFSHKKLNNDAQELCNLLEKVRATMLEYDSDSRESDGELSKDDGHPNYGFRDIAFATKCLMELLPSLERNETISQRRPPNEITAPKSVFKVSEPAGYFVSHVVDRFRAADLRLAERLGEANWQRHERLRKQTEEPPVNDDATEPAPVSKFCPVSMFHDSDIAMSRYTVSEASHTSFVTSVGEKERGALRVPDVPVDIALGAPFRCKFCGQTLYKIKNRYDWKIHVFADLKPYICTWPSCKDELATFPTRKLWSKHEFEQHRSEKSWRCFECSTDVGGPEELREHLKDHHQTVLSESQSSMAVSLAKVRHAPSLQDMKCPLCSDHQCDTWRAFETHVGKHMEEIALASLPREGSTDSSESSHHSSVAETDIVPGPGEPSGEVIKSPPTLPKQKDPDYINDPDPSTNKLKNSDMVCSTTARGSHFPPSRAPYKYYNQERFKLWVCCQCGNRPTDLVVDVCNYCYHPRCWGCRHIWDG